MLDVFAKLNLFIQEKIIRQKLGNWSISVANSYSTKLTTCLPLFVSKIWEDELMAALLNKSKKF